jgi:hypothetical protein
VQLRPLLTIAALTTALALSGCTSEEPAASPSDLPAPAITSTDEADDSDEPLEEPASDSASYAQIEELIAAITAADGSCGDWKQDDAVAGSTASGTCGDTYVVALFGSAAERDVPVNEDQLSDDPGTFLIGANWFVMAGPDGSFDDLTALREALGGFVVPTGS